jgi:hypothetical protein
MSIAPEAPVVFRLRTVIDFELENVLIEDYGPPVLENPPDIRDSLRALYESALAGVLAFRMRIPLEDVWLESPNLPTAEQIRSEFLSYPQARVRVDAHVHDNGQAHVTFERLGGRHDNVGREDGLLLTDRICGLLAGYIVEQLGQVDPSTDNLPRPM